jgi:hypothetical protein
MGFQDWNKAGKMAEEIQTKLNQGEILHVIKILFNNLDKPHLEEIVLILQNTGYIPRGELYEPLKDGERVAYANVRVHLQKQTPTNKSVKKVLDYLIAWINQQEGTIQ